MTECGDTSAKVTVPLVDNWEFLAEYCSILWAEYTRYASTVKCKNVNHVFPSQLQIGIYEYLSVTLHFYQFNDIVKLSTHVDALEKHQFFQLDFVDFKLVNCFKIRLARAVFVLLHHLNYSFLFVIVN